MKNGFRAGPASIFPFGLGGQAIGLLFLGTEFFAKLDRIEPGDAFDRIIGRVPVLHLLLAAALSAEMAGVGAHYLCILLLCHFEGAEIERLGDRDVVLGLVAAAMLFL